MPKTSLHSNSLSLNFSTFFFGFLKLFVGGIYIFAGVVKLVDPVGAGIKFHDYLAAFGMSFLQPIALLLGVLAALAEFTLGLSLILGIFKKQIIHTVLGVTVFFTLLTFVLALTNPVTDCGCFGDAIKLTNWQTFYKNLVLLSAVVVIFIFRHKMRQLKGGIRPWLLLIFIVLVGAYIPHYSYHHLPIVDFRPFAVGNHIPSLMKVPVGAPEDEYKTVFYYQKNGETKEFDESNYPWQDSTWVFVEMKSELVKKGFEPPIHNFIIESLSEGDITTQILTSDDYQYLLIAQQLEEIPPKAIDKIKILTDDLLQNGQNLTVVTSSSQQDINSFKSNNNLNSAFANADLTLLKTIIRSKAGLLIVKQGTVIGKYNYNDFPNADYFQNPIGSELVVKSTLKSRLIFVYLLLILGLGIFLILRISPEHN